LAGGSSGLRENSELNINALSFMCSESMNGVVEDQARVGGFANMLFSLATGPFSPSICNLGLVVQRELRICALSPDTRHQTLLDIAHILIGLAGLRLRPLAGMSEARFRKRQRHTNSKSTRKGNR
jgi:hypothetical protein